VGFYFVFMMIVVIRVVIGIWKTEAYSCLVLGDQEVSFMYLSCFHSFGFCMKNSFGLSQIAHIHLGAN
jgi:hypothetical protein